MYLAINNKLTRHEKVYNYSFTQHLYISMNIDHKLQLTELKIIIVTLTEINRNGRMILWIL